MPFDPYQSGTAFRNYLARPPATVAALGQPIEPDKQSTVGAFLRGVFGLARPGGQPTGKAAVALGASPNDPYVPANPAAQEAHDKGQAFTARDIQGLGHLSPAAQAVVRNSSPLTYAAVQAANAKNAPPKTLQGAPAFEDLLQAYAHANGGNISLRALSQLGDIAAKTTYPHHVQSNADIAAGNALDIGSQLANYKMALAQKSGDKEGYLKAWQEYQDLNERLARARAIDPVTAADMAGYTGGN